MADTAGMHEDRRGLRFGFEASAEVLPENASGSTKGRVTELSLRGCFVELAGAFAEQQSTVVKLFHGKEMFEARARVIYVRATGVGLLFTEINPHFRTVLQKWVLAALDQHAERKSEVET